MNTPPRLSELPVKPHGHVLTNHENMLIIEENKAMKKRRMRASKKTTMKETSGTYTSLFTSMLAPHARLSFVRKFLFICKEGESLVHFDQVQRWLNMVSN